MPMNNSNKEIIMKKIHLLCNAHLDPVWQWEWEEGAAAAVSTFRAAAMFCDEFNGFIFNHNEALLYQWIEEYEPQLFKKIQELVRLGKWHIIGGWYLQPDCNMPSGESFVRQILHGKKYFKDKFGVEPSTAVNFDSFGHTRGLVQILKKSGYHSYLLMRPGQDSLPLPDQDFMWVGYDNSEIMTHRLATGYNSPLGHADKKIMDWIERNNTKELSLLPWGVGNHGGGPSREDLRKIEQLMNGIDDFDIIHSTPELYFSDLNKSGKELTHFYMGLNPCFIGCYTSQIRIKQKHRQLENQLYLTEKMLSSASLQGYMKYPQQEIKEAFKDLLTSEFHDILPGSSVQPVEESSINIMNHGLEIASRLRARAFFALASGQKAASNGEIPILIYNPHPYKVESIFECEFMLADQNWKDEFTMPAVYKDNVQLPSQPEKEMSSIPLDWRKRVAFSAVLEPSCINRFDCRLSILPQKPLPSLKEKDGKLTFITSDIEVIINCKTGLMDVYKVHGKDYLKNNAFLPIVIDDNEDPWRMDVNSLRTVSGYFELMSDADSAWFSGVSAKQLKSVRVIEDGDVRSVVEAVLKYNNSYICMHYKLPKKGTEIQLQVRVIWNEKAKMLKLSVPTVFTTAKYFGQTAYGFEELPNNGVEAVSQKWSGVFSENENHALTLINDGIYGSDYVDGEIRLSLLRSPGYCAHPIEDRQIMLQDRYAPRIDQGERLYDFWLNAGEAHERLKSIDREALINNEKPYTLSFFPSGSGSKPLPLVSLSDDAIEMTTFKKSEGSEDYIIRLFEPTGTERETNISLLGGKINKEISFKGFEIKTLRFSTDNGIITETDLMED